MTDDPHQRHVRISFDSSNFDHVVRYPRPLNIGHGETLDLTKTKLAKDHERFPKVDPGKLLSAEDLRKRGQST